MFAVGIVYRLATEINKDSAIVKILFTFTDMRRGHYIEGKMPKGKISQIRAILLVAVLELEKLEKNETEAPSKKREKKPPPMRLVLIKGGKS